MDPTVAATKIQTAFRGYRARNLFNSVYKKVKARNQFAVEHDALSKRLEQKLTVNEALKKAANSKIDASRETLVNAAISIQRAWKHTQAQSDIIGILRDQKKLKITCLIQRAVRKWLTLKNIPIDPEPPAIDYSQAAFDYLRSRPPNHSLGHPVKSLPPVHYQFHNRLITRSRELRARLENQSVLGAPSKSLLPQARSDIAEQLRIRNFQVEGVSRQDVELLSRFEKMLAN